MDEDGGVQQIVNLCEAGITLVINLMEDSETELYQRIFDSYEPLLKALAGEKGNSIRVERFAIKDRSIPTVELMEKIQRAINEEIARGGVVYVHCMGGIGRTGTVIGCYLKDHGEPNPLGKLRALTQSEKEHFWPTPQTEEQSRFVSNWRKP